MRQLALGLLLAGGLWAQSVPPPALGSPPPVLPAPPKPQRVVLEITPLAYDEAPLIALAKNPRLSVSLAKVREQLAKVDTLAAPARPQTLLQLLGPPIPQSATDSSFRTDFVLSPVRLEMRQLVFDGGRIMAQLRQGKELAKQLALQAQVDWQKLAFDVRKAYLDALTSQNQMSLAEEQLKLTRAQLAESEARYRVGKVPKGDVLSAQLPVSEADLKVQKKRAEAAQRLEDLNQLLGLSLSTPLHLSPPKVPENTLAPLDECLKEAFAQQPSIKALEHQVAAAVSQIEAGELDNHPQINVILGLAGISQGTQVIGGLSYRGGFEVNWPLTDGGLAKSKASLGRATLDRSLAELAEERRKVEQRVRQSFRDLEMAVETHRLEKARVSQARDSLRIAQAQYRAGIIHVYPVREAQTDLFDSQVAELVAYHDYFIRLADLDLACGRQPGALLQTDWPEDD